MVCSGMWARQLIKPFKHAQLCGCLLALCIANQTITVFVALLLDFSMAEKSPTPPPKRPRRRCHFDPNEFPCVGRSSKVITDSTLWKLHS